jgi:isoamylase
VDSSPRWEVVIDTSGERADSPPLAGGDAFELQPKALVVLRDHEETEPDLDHSVAASLAARTTPIDTIPAHAPQAELPG